MKRTGIMGGTFNPIHNGHLLLAQRALEEYKLDLVLFIPSGMPAYKNNGHILSGEVRLYLVLEAIKDNDSFSASDIEIKRQNYTYTFDTLKELKRMEPDTEFYFIMGQDSINNFHKWYRYEDLFSMCNFVVAFRKGESDEQTYKVISHYRDNYNAKIDFLNMPYMEISSTDIRERFLNNKSLKYIIPDSVYKYMNDSKDIIKKIWRHNNE